MTKNSLYKWEKTITVIQLQEHDRAGYPIGVLKMIELVPLTRSFVDTPERGVSGRVKIIGFIGSKIMQSSGDECVTF